MSAWGIVVDPVTARGILSGRITAVRRLAGSPLAGCRRGDAVAMLEACVLARTDGAGREAAAAPGHADVAVFADGWRHYRAGGGVAGVAPNNPRLLWTPAIRMPRWAVRAVLILGQPRVERLRAIDADGLRAEGLRPLPGGLGWRGVDGALTRDPRGAFAAGWDRSHPTPGECWADDPLIVTLPIAAVRHA